MKRAKPPGAARVAQARAHGELLRKVGLWAFVLWVCFESLSIWKLLRLPWLLPVVEIGQDTFAPGIGSEQIPAIVHHLSRTSDIKDTWSQSYLSTKGVHLRYGEDVYEHKLWTDELIEKFFEENYPDFLDTFKSYPQDIERVDVARYFIVFHYGGIYMDLDIGARRSLDNLRRYDEQRSARGTCTNLILPITQPLGISNDFFMASKNHPFLRFVTDRLAARGRAGKFFSMFSLPFFSVMWTTGPLFFSVALYDYLASVPALKRAEVAFLSSHDYTRKLLYHVPGSSWLSWDGKIVMWFWFTGLPWIATMFRYAALGACCLLCLLVAARWGSVRQNKTSRSRLTGVDDASLV